MTNLECAVAVLVKHREARGWTDTEVATDLLGQLGLEADAKAKNPAVTEDDAPPDAPDDDAARRRRPAKR